MSTRVTRPDQQLVGGDVIIIHRRRQGRYGSYTTKSFACATGKQTTTRARLVLLSPNAEDMRFQHTHSVVEDYTEKLDENEWPEGVIAMRILAITKGLVRLD